MDELHQQVQLNTPSPASPASPEESSWKSQNNILMTPKRVEVGDNTINKIVMDPVKGFTNGRMIFDNSNLTAVRTLTFPDSDLTLLAYPIPISAGGTGQTTKAPAFDALAPTTTKGDIIAYTGVTNAVVGIGTVGQGLVVDPTFPEAIKWSSLSYPLAVRTSQFSLNNSSTETDVISQFNLPAGALTSGRSIKFEFFVQVQNNNVTENFTFNMYFGGSAVGTFTLSVPSNNIAYTGFITGLITYTGASAQYISGLANLNAVGNGTGFTQTITLQAFITTTSAVNSANLQAIKFTAKMTSASALETITINGGMITLV